MLHALKGGGKRAFYRWLCRDYLPLFPKLPERTRLFRLFVTHQDLARRFLADPTVLGVIDSYGIELIHPVREGRSCQQIGRKGLVDETDLWLDVAQHVSLGRETVQMAVSGGDMVLQIGKVTYYPDPDYDLMLLCVDTDGKLVPEVSLPLRFLVEGRVQHLGEITGYFGGGSCTVNPDFTLTVDQEWRYVGEGGIRSGVPIP